MLCSMVWPRWSRWQRQGGPLRVAMGQSLDGGLAPEFVEWALQGRRHCVPSRKNFRRALGLIVTDKSFAALVWPELPKAVCLCWQDSTH
jgi:hypothetical protein